MRYYDIQISGAKGASSTRRFTSYVSGRSLPGALDVSLDVPVIPFATPMGDAWIQIRGVALQDISQASDLNDSSIRVYAGFQRGLPLANPSQAGLIVQGFVFQAFGNWIGTEQTLDLVIRAGTTPTNIVLDWKAGTKLSSALATTLSTAFPGYQQVVKISDRLVRQNDEVGYYQSLTQLSQYLNQTSKNIIGGTYQGVSVVLDQKTVTAYDGTSTSETSTSKQIDFKDLIGQPTWIGPNTIQMKNPMRADIKVGDEIKMPQTITTNTAAALSSLTNQRAAFQGSFQVSVVRHIGSYRQPDAASWVTVVEAFPTKIAA